MTNPIDRLLVKQFTSEQYNEPDGKLITAPTQSLEDQINTWVEQTKHLIVDVSAPAILREWADGDYSQIHVIQTVMVIYRPYAPFM